MAAAAPAVGGAAQEGVGESSSPPRGPEPAPSASGGSGRGGGAGAGGGGLRDVCREVYERLVADGHAETFVPGLRARLEAHFARLPTRWAACFPDLPPLLSYHYCVRVECIGGSGMLRTGSEMVGDSLAIEVEFVKFAPVCARISLSGSLICQFRGCYNQRIRDGMTISFCALVVWHVEFQLNLSYLCLRIQGVYSVLPMEQCLVYWARSVQLCFVALK